METFFTSDTHFNHFNIIKYCDRPFQSVQEMNHTLIAKWNAVVSPDDVVWHLGDFAFGPPGVCMGLFYALNGTKYLIRGNHDHNDQKMLGVGFKEVHKRFAWNGWWLVHRPRSAPLGSDQVLCGHVHDHWRRLGNYINVGVDVWDFAPRTLDELVKAQKDAERYEETEEGLGS